MTNTPIHQLDVVALTCDLPAHALTLGQAGTVVHIHSPKSFEVELLDNNGHTCALTTLRANQLLRLNFTPAEAA